MIDLLTGCVAQNKGGREEGAEGRKLLKEEERKEHKIIIITNGENSNFLTYYKHGNNVCSGYEKKISFISFAS